MGALVTFALFLADFLTEFSSWTLSRNQSIVTVVALAYPATLPPTVGNLARLASMPLAGLSFMALSIWVEAPLVAAQGKSQVFAFRSTSKLPEVPGDISC